MGSTRESFQLIRCMVLDFLTNLTSVDMKVATNLKMFASEIFIQKVTKLFDNISPHMKLMLSWILPLSDLENMLDCLKNLTTRQLFLMLIHTNVLEVRTTGQRNQMAGQNT